MKLLGYAKGPFHASRKQLRSNTGGRVYPTRYFLESGEWEAEPANKTMMNLEGLFGSAPLAHFEVYEGPFGRRRYKPVGIHVTGTNDYRPVTLGNMLERRSIIILNYIITAAWKY